MGEYYEDGGVAGASPLTIMHEPILKYVNENAKSMHIIYVNSVDLSNPNDKPVGNILDSIKGATGSLIRSIIIADRLAGYKLLRYYCDRESSEKKSINRAEFSCTYENVECVKIVQSKIKYSMLEIYPIDKFDVNIVNFTGEDVINGIHDAYENCKCHFWWLCTNDEISKNMSDMIDLCKIR